MHSACTPVFQLTTPAETRRLAAIHPLVPQTPIHSVSVSIIVIIIIII
jgi:hypothetical protein